MAAKQPQNTIFFEFVQNLQLVPGLTNFTVFDVEVVDQISALYRILYLYRETKKIVPLIYPDEISRATKRSAIRFIFKAKKLDNNVLQDAVNRSFTGATVTIGEHSTVLSIS